MEVYVFILFPTAISKRTEISIEHDGGEKIRLNVKQESEDGYVTLDYEEAKKLAEYINGMNLAKKESK